MARRAQDLAQRLDLPVVAAAIVLVLGAAQLLAGPLSAGVTIDEPIEANETMSWIEHGWYLPDYLLADGRPDPDNELSSPYVYGPAFGAVAHAANVVAGNEALDEISHSAGAYTVRHLVTAALAALAVAAVGAAAWLFTRSRRFGLWAAAGLLAVPAWLGHAFFNPKDIPAACGYTLLTVALAFALCEPPNGSSPRRRLAVGAMLAAGILVGAGTRLALLVPFLLSVAAYAALRIGQWRLGGIKRDPGADLAVAAGTGGGLGAIAILYPKVAAAPGELLVGSVSGSGGYPWQGVTLTAGQLLPEHPPWWYLPAWIGASYPLLLAALAVLGLLVGGRMLVRARIDSGGRALAWDSPGLGLLLVLQQGLLIPLGAILTGAVMYSGMRQHLYVLPAMAILAGVGAQRLWSWAQSRPRVTKALTGVALSAALAVPMAEQTLLFPYNYAYVNAAAGIGGVEDRWESDYWVASAPEALSRVPEGADLRCYLVMPSVPCDSEQLAPFEDVRGTEASPRWQGDDDATWVIVRRHAGNRPPDYCDPADDVTRWLRGETVTMSFVLRCNPTRLG